MLLFIDIEWYYKLMMYVYVKKFIGGCYVMWFVKMFNIQNYSYWIKNTYLHSCNKWNRVKYIYKKNSMKKNIL